MEEPDETGPAIVLKEPDIADWFYAPVWEYALRPSRGVGATDPARWLIFDDGDVGGRAAAQLAAQGHDVVRRAAGPLTSANRIGRRITIDPRQRSHYVTLIERLAAESRLPDNVLHLWSIGSLEHRDVRARAHSSTGSSSASTAYLHVVQAMLAKASPHPCSSSSASTELHGGDRRDPVSPAKAAADSVLAGRCPQEYPHIACRSVDVDVAPRDQDAAELAAERSSSPSSPTSRCVPRSHIAGVNAGRRSFEPIRIEDGEATVFSAALARRLPDHRRPGQDRPGAGPRARRAVHARLVLVGRSHVTEPERWDTGWPSTASRTRRARRSAVCGRSRPVAPRCCCSAADVADGAQMRAVVDAAHARFGSLDGVIHGAGNVTAEGFFGVDEADAGALRAAVPHQNRGARVAR